MILFRRHNSADRIESSLGAHVGSTFSEVAAPFCFRCSDVLCCHCVSVNQSPLSSTFAGLCSVIVAFLMHLHIFSKRDLALLLTDNETVFFFFLFFFFFWFIIIILKLNSMTKPFWN